MLKCVERAKSGLLAPRDSRMLNLFVWGVEIAVIIVETGTNNLHT